MKTYYVESNSRWFVVTTKNKKRAQAIANSELGKRFVLCVREATKNEVDSYITNKGEQAMIDDV